MVSFMPPGPLVEDCTIEGQASIAQLMAHELFPIVEKATLAMRIIYSETGNLNGCFFREFNSEEFNGTLSLILQTMHLHGISVTDTILREMIREVREQISLKASEIQVARNRKELFMILTDGASAAFPRNMHFELVQQIEAQESSFVDHILTALEKGTIWEHLLAILIYLYR